MVSCAHVSGLVSGIWVLGPKLIVLFEKNLGIIALPEVVNKWTRALICQMAHITAIFFSVFSYFDASCGFSAINVTISDSFCHISLSWRDYMFVIIIPPIFFEVSVTIVFYGNRKVMTTIWSVLEEKNNSWMCWFHLATVMKNLSETFLLSNH